MHARTAVACVAIMFVHSHPCLQGNVVAGSAPGMVDPSIAVNPDGQPVENPPEATKELDKEQAEMLLQVCCRSVRGFSQTTLCACISSMPCCVACSRADFPT
jgi:hypothetical protein